MTTKFDKLKQEMKKDKQRQVDSWVKLQIGNIKARLGDPDKIKKLKDVEKEIIEQYNADTLTVELRNKLSLKIQRIH